MINKTHFIILSLIVLPTFILGQTIRNKFHDFSRKLSDSLCSFDLKSCKVFYLESNKRDQLLEDKKKINGYFIKEQLNLKDSLLDKTLSILTDSLSFSSDSLTKSCAFEPELYLELIGEHRRKIHIVISMTCRQTAIVTSNFKVLNGFGDMSDVIFNFLRNNFYKK